MWVNIMSFGVFYNYIKLTLVASLLEAEIIKRENALYECALAVEKDDSLKNDMSLWDVAICDGLENFDASTSKKG
jgi:hypothetical protein